MRRLAFVLLFAPLLVIAAEKTIPARTYDDVTGLPLAVKTVRRDPSTPTQWYMEACFVARQTDAGFIPLPQPCASCYGPDTNATEQLCRAKVASNPENGL